MVYSCQNHLSKEFPIKKGDLIIRFGIECVLFITVGICDNIIIMFLSKNCIDKRQSSPSVSLMTARRFYFTTTNRKRHRHNINCIIFAQFIQLRSFSYSLLVLINFKVPMLISYL